MRGRTDIVRFVAVMVILALGCDRPITAGPPTVAVPVDPWIIESSRQDPGAQAFAPCAGCHGHDGRGRADGSVPRLAGQLDSILVGKLDSIRNHKTWLPVMKPFAAGMDYTQVTAVARFLYNLDPVDPTKSPSPSDAYTALCASCHGSRGEGSAILGAPRLCGQHPAYVERRLDEISRNVRGDADPAMSAIVTGQAKEVLQDAVAWLGNADCRPGTAP